MGGKLTNQNYIDNVHLEGWWTQPYMSWKFWMGIICHKNWSCVTHWQRKMGSFGILTRINDGVYVCICSVYSIILNQWTQHDFVYDSYFRTTGNNACQGAIIDNRRCAPICVLEEKYWETTTKLKNMLRNFFEGTCNVKYAFKITSRDS